MMNERIKELAEQAAQATRMLYDNAYWRMQEQGEDVAWREKFAELIVKECASYMKQSNAFTYANQADDCAQRMLKHFGVKE